MSRRLLAACEQQVMKNSVFRLLKKISEARRAKNRRAEAYFTGYVGARRLSATKPMSLFQQPEQESVKKRSQQTCLPQSYDRNDSGN